VKLYTYTLIPIDYQFPSPVPYVIISEIYEPTEEEFDVETVALFFAGWQEDLLADEIDVNEETLPFYLNNTAENQVESRLFGKRYRPSGRVTVFNTDSGSAEPLLKAKISIGRNFFWRNTYTSNNGNFEAPKKYRGKVRIRAKWRGETATIRRTLNELAGLWVSDHLMTITRGNNGATKNIVYGEAHDGAFGVDMVGGHLWYKGTVHNGLRKYNDFASSNGISHRVNSANTWCFAKGDASSAPMLKRFPQLATLSTVANIGQANFWSVMTNVAAGFAIQLVPVHLRPDFIYGGLRNKTLVVGGQSNTVRIHQTVFHESSHFSHASKAGAWFWAQNFASQMSNNISFNNPYYAGVSPSQQAGRIIALAEGWANFCEFKITSTIYNRAYMNIGGFRSMHNLAGVSNNLETFNKYDVPMVVTNITDNQHWFAHGVMWDVMDNVVDDPTISRRRTSDGLPLNGIIDECFIGNSSNANDLAPLFNRLNGNVETPAELRDALVSAFPAQARQIISLFESYGY
jgi:hypothetical protein